MNDESIVPIARLGQLAEHIPAAVADPVLAMIERAVRDPSVDVGKMRELLQMRKEAAREVAKEAFDAAMTRAQAEMRTVGTDRRNDQTRSNYATYAKLDKAVRQIYTAHGFSLSFNTAKADAPENVRVLCDVTNGSYTKEYSIDMPADGKGAKGGDVMTKTHATGSAVSYGMRYLLKMIFNLSTGEEPQDDDGNAASSVEACISVEQAATLRKLLAETAGGEPKFLEFAQIERLEDMVASKYEMAAKLIKSSPRREPVKGVSR